MKEEARGMRRSSLIQVCFCTYPAVLRLWLRRTTPSCSAGVQSQNSSQTLRHLSSTAGEIEIEIEKGEEKKEGHMISTLAQAWCRHGSSRRQNIKDHFKKSFRGARARERETGRQRQTERQMKGENKCFFALHCKRAKLKLLSTTYTTHKFKEMRARERWRWKKEGAGSG